MRTRLAVVVFACSALTACGSLKDALTDHVNTVARVGSSSLSVTQLAGLIGGAKIDVPITRENAEILTNIWADYHRMAYAGAHGDSLIDMIDIAMIPLFNSERVTMYQDSVRKTMPIDSASQAGYEAGAGGLYDARHILLKFPDSSGTPCQPFPCPSARQRDSVHQAALAFAAQVTNANFADMAKMHSADPGSAARGGALGVFPKDQMIAEFSKATAALKPGEISAPVASSYGEHIIQRRTYADVRDEYAAAFNRNAAQVADRTWRDQISKEYNVAVKKDAGAVAKQAASAPGAHREDQAAIATFKGGEMTVAEFLVWLQSRPAEDRIQKQVAEAADSLVVNFVKDVAIQEVFLRKAVAAGVQISAQERDSLHGQFRQLYGQVQQQLGVSPQQLADSAKTVREREMLADRRVDGLIARFMAGEGQPLDVPAPIKSVLDAKYDVKVSVVSLNRVVEEANKIRASSDSTRGAGRR